MAMSIEHQKSNIKQLLDAPASNRELTLLLIIEGLIEQIEQLKSNKDDGK